MLSNVLPLYVTGVDSGLMVDCGYARSQILPVARSRICIEGLVTSETGACVVEKEINKYLIQDNKTNKAMLTEA